jgi:hypothetical protein
MGKHTAEQLRGAMDAIDASDHFVVIAVRAMPENPPGYTVGIYSSDMFVVGQVLDLAIAYYKAYMIQAEDPKSGPTPNAPGKET